MKLTLWQQFGSNHSSSFTVVGEFPTPEAAQKAVMELRRILQKIADWHEAHGDESNELFNSGDWMSHLSPPEQELAREYGIQWDAAIDWYASVHIDIQLDRYVFITSAWQTDGVGDPFDRVMDKIGGKGFLSGYGVGGLTFEFTFTVTCDAPDEATAQAVVDENLGYYREIRRDGTHLVFDRWPFREHPSLVDLITELRRLSCTNIEFMLNRLELEEMLPAGADLERIVRVLRYANDEGERAKAADRLRDAPDVRAFVDLLAALEDEEDKWVRMAVVQALAALNDARAVPPLLRLLETSDESLVRQSIIGALVGFKTDTAIEGLSIGLQDRSATVWEQAARELAAVGARARDAVQKLADKPGMAERVKLMLALIDAAEQPDSLLARIRSTDKTVSRAAVDEAKQQNAVEILIFALQIPVDSSQAARVAMALGELRDARAIPALIGRLKYGDAYKLQNALVQIGEAAVQPLIQYLQNEAAEERTFPTALYILTHMDAVDALAEFAAHPVYRRAVLEILRNYHRSQSVPVLMAMLKHKDIELRQGTIRALVDVKATEAIDMLDTMAVKDSSGVIRREAKQAVETLRREKPYR